LKKHKKYHYPHEFRFLKLSHHSIKHQKQCDDSDSDESSSTETEGEEEEEEEEVVYGEVEPY